MVVSDPVTRTMAPWSGVRFSSTTVPDIRTACAGAKSATTMRTRLAIKTRIGHEYRIEFFPWRDLFLRSGEAEIDARTELARLRRHRGVPRRHHHPRYSGGAPATRLEGLFRGRAGDP